MQKKIIALAVAALASGAALAQSNVTVYGVVDASYENIKATGATGNAVGAADNAQNMNSRSRIASNSSYIGFKGTEDLGNGLKALFQVETQFAVDNATGATTGNAGAVVGTATSSLANRDSFVGVTGNFGTAVMGFLSTPHRNLLAGWDVNPGATGSAADNSLLGKINLGVLRNANGTTTNTFGATNANLIFRTQAVAYVSPTFSGFSGVIAYVPNENKTTLANNAADVVGAGTQVNPSAWNLGLNYANGPIKVGYSYLTAKDVVAAGAAVGGLGANTGSKTKSHLAAGSYKLGDLTLGLAYNRNVQDVEGTAVNTITGFTNSVWGVNAKYVMGASEFAGQYQRANNGSVRVNGTVAGDNGDRGASMFSLRYGYNMSKRTQAYALYSQISNKANGNYDFGAGLAAGTTQANIGAGADPKSFGVGLRHSF